METRSEPDWGEVMTLEGAVRGSQGTILVDEAVVTLCRVTDRVSVKVNVSHIPHGSEELRSC
jgi:hypothetical protein